MSNQSSSKIFEMVSAENFLRGVTSLILPPFILSCVGTLVVRSVINTLFSVSGLQNKGVSFRTLIWIQIVEADSAQQLRCSFVCQSVPSHIIADYATTVRVSIFYHKDCIIYFMLIQNLQGHKNCMISSKFTAILITKGWVLNT